MDLNTISLPLSLADFKMLDEAMENGTIQWKDFPTNLMDSYSDWNKKKNKPIQEMLKTKDDWSPFE